MGEGRSHICNHVGSVLLLQEISKVDHDTLSPSKTIPSQIPLRLDITNLKIDVDICDYVISINQYCKRWVLLEQNHSLISATIPTRDSDWATGTARANATRESARMVLMNIIVFACDKLIVMKREREKLKLGMRISCADKGLIYT
jgi:hypothetical protein